MSDKKKTPYFIPEITKGSKEGMKRLHEEFKTAMKNDAPNETVTPAGMRWLRNVYPQLVKGMEERGLIAAQQQAEPHPSQAHPTFQTVSLPNGPGTPSAQTFDRRIACKPGRPEWKSCEQQAEPKRCEYCDGTGDVTRADGEWLGECTVCKKAEPSSFRASVETMVRMLEEGEWAEHVAATTGKGDPLAQRLEAAITGLINETHGGAE